MGKSSPQAPAAPDYSGAATATAEGNLEAARAAASANRVNQVTPYGNLTYSQTGTNPDGGWTATQSLSPAQQAILDQSNQLNQGLMGTANKGLTYANDVLSQPGVTGYDAEKPGDFREGATTTGFNPSNFTSGESTSQISPGDLRVSGQPSGSAPESFSEGSPTTGFNPGQSYQDAMMSRLAPQIDRENAQSDSQLANQGIMQGSEAYKNAKTMLGQNQNDRLNNATVQGLSAGLQANQQNYNQNQGQYQAGIIGRQQGMAENQQNYGQNQGQFQAELAGRQQGMQANQQNFGQNQAQFQANNAANQQGFQQEAYNQMQPINVINALRTGSQVQSPSFVNSPQQQTTGGADMFGAANSQNQYNMGLYNSQVGENNSQRGAVVGLAAAAAMAF